MPTLIRRCWRALGRKRFTTIHLFLSEQRRHVTPWQAFCGVSVPWYLRPMYQPNGHQGELITNPGPEIEARPCQRCVKFAEKNR